MDMEGPYKRNGKLLRKLDQIEQVERSDMRMLETARHRLRSKLKRFELPQLSSGSDAMDVRMYDTHNPGFCYHCNGSIKASEISPRKNFIDVFDVVHSMLFTNGEVDPDKVLCLHVLAAHYAKSGSTESLGIRPITPLVERGKKENFSGAWNSVLPCYVLEIERNVDEVINFSDEMKRHKNPFVMEAEEEIVKDLECEYEKYVQDNSDVGLALSTNQKRTKMVPNGIGKIMIIPPHVYSLLGAAQELKIKQTIAEESQRKKFRRSDSSIKNVDDQSFSFRLEDEDDAVSRRLMTATSLRGWSGQRNIGASKVSAFRSISRKSATSSRRTNPSITTLKRASPRSSNVPPSSEDIQADAQIVTIKSTDQAIGGVISKTSSTKSPFRNFPSVHGPQSPCSNSIISGISGSLEESKKTLRPIFINSPVNSLDLRSREYETVPILVNNQMQALVHSVLDVLERVNPTKMRRIVSTANSPHEIRRMLIRPDIQLFIDSLVGQPLISSPNSFVVSTALILDAIDPRVENSIEKELVATTLVVPLAPGLHHLVEEIRKNIFVDPDQPITGSKAEFKIETFGRQRQKLLESKFPAREESEKERNVFDVDTSCLHSDVKENKMTCACCYAKWKDSLPDEEQSKLPDYSFSANNESESTLKNSAKYGTNTSGINSSIIDHVDQNFKNRAAGISISKIPNQDTKIKAESSVNKTEELRSSKSKPLKTGTVPKSTTLNTSKRSASMKANQQPQYSFKDRTRLSDVKISVDKINEPQSYKGYTSISASTTDRDSIMTRSLQKRCSNITLNDDAPSPKCQFKPWKASQNPCYLDPDRLILRRMTNPQRILVGQMCASLKTRKINAEGLVKERTPLAALITPVLSHETLRILTKGTRRRLSKKEEAKIEDNADRGTAAVMSEKLTGPVLAKIRQAIAENETNRRLTSFLKDKI